MRMTEPLPNWRSIWVRAPCRAVSLAFAGSWMLMPTTLGRGADGIQHAFAPKPCQNCADFAQAPGPRVPRGKATTLASGTGTFDHERTIDLARWVGVWSQSVLTGNFATTPPRSRVIDWARWREWREGPRRVMGWAAGAARVAM